MLVCALLIASATHAPTTGSVAVLADDASWIKAARARLGDQLLDADAVRRGQVDAAKLGVKCAAGDATCAAKIGALAGADTVVIVRSAASGLTFVAVDAAGKELHASGPWPASLALDDVVDAIGAALNPADGFVYVRAAKDARVRIDDAAKPTSARPYVLSPGPHDLVVEKEGFITSTNRVDVEAGRVIVVTPVLTKAPPATASTKAPPATAASTSSSSSPSPSSSSSSPSSSSPSPSSSPSSLSSSSSPSTSSSSSAPSSSSSSSSSPPSSSSSSSSSLASSSGGVKALNVGLPVAVGAGAFAVVGAAAAVGAIVTNAQLDDPTSGPAERQLEFSAGQVFVVTAVATGVVAGAGAVAAAWLWSD